MEFSDAFWATATGAIVGAVVGAAASWVFALDLRRRASRSDEHSRADAAIAEVVVRLGELSGTAAAFAFGIASRRPAGQSPHIARHQLLSAIAVAQMAVRDGHPLRNLKALVATPAQARSGAAFEQAAMLLIEWRRGDISAREAGDAIKMLRE